MFENTSLMLRGIFGHKTRSDTDDRSNYALRGSIIRITNLLPFLYQGRYDWWNIQNASLWGTKTARTHKILVDKTQLWSRENNFKMDPKRICWKGVVHGGQQETRE